MELYLATDSGRLQQAMACTAQLAHMSYRIGPDGDASGLPLPDTLRGGLLMLSDEGGTYPDARRACAASWCRNVCVGGTPA